jgi:hypothetical protein
MNIKVCPSHLPCLPGSQWGYTARGSGWGWFGVYISQGKEGGVHGVSSCFFLFSKKKKNIVSIHGWWERIEQIGIWIALIPLPVLLIEANCKAHGRL